jgi:aconitate hydratase 2/2-methylisocitrate dehydratase
MGGQCLSAHRLTLFVAGKTTCLPYEKSSLKEFIMLEDYRKHVEERAADGVVPKPLDAEQMAALVELLKQTPAGEEEFILDLLANRVPAGVDEAAYIKAGFLAAIAKGEVNSPILNAADATELLRH